MSPTIMSCESVGVLGVLPLTLEQDSPTSDGEKTNGGSCVMDGATPFKEEKATSEPEHVKVAEEADPAGANDVDGLREVMMVVEGGGIAEEDDNGKGEGMMD